jgi:Fe-S-cluster containining protein
MTDKLSLKYICDTKCNDYKCCTATGPAIIFDFEISNKPSIKEFVEDTEISEIKIIPRNEYGCPYLDEGNCSIQEQKFIDCRIYPLGFNKEGKLGIDEDNKCPATDYLPQKYFDTVKEIAKNISLELRKKMGRINEKNDYFYISNEKLEQKLK